ncbi:hypothetical protein [Arthrobacter sp. MAHUQ-56]|uniref:hypothetical protein n=1 Tax=Arthrobacter sp. MAHUQ-56 TaxID=2867411 RepID=UPI001C862D79|nr:hypothetical protein [Arthrobacter sp. MAHUQ-56]
MRLVLCLADKKEWKVDDFNSLARQEINLRRSRLVCIACGGKAYFRRSGRNTRPSFWARHIAGCKVVTPTWSAFRYLQ